MATEHIYAPSDTVTRSGRADILLQRYFPLDASVHMMSGRQKFEQYFGDLSQVLRENLEQPLDYAIAPASGSFLGPLLLVDTLVMYDQTPLINTEEPLRETLLARKTRQFLSEIPDSAPYLLRVPQELQRYARDVVDAGFEPHGKLRGIDNLASIIAGALFLGVAIDDITIRPYTYTDESPAYELTFPINGVVKRVYYHAEQLADIREMSEDHAQDEKKTMAQSIFFRHPDLRQQQGLLFVQANLTRLSEILETIPFSAVITDVQRSIPLSFLDTYRFLPFPSNPERYFPLQRRGYNTEIGYSPLNMWIGVREATQE